MVAEDIFKIDINENHEVAKATRRSVTQRSVAGTPSLTEDTDTADCCLDKRCVDPTEVDCFAER